MYSKAALPLVGVCSGENSIVESLEAGANDYVLAPLRRPELLARIRTLLSPVARSGSGLSGSRRTTVQR